MSRTTFLKGSIRFSGYCITGILLAVSGLQQVLAETSKLDETLMLEEVLVTAQKTSELLKESPLTVNVISSDEINAFAIFDATELSKLTSGVEVRNEGDSNTGMAIRGVGTLAQQATPPRVGIYLDDWYAGAQTQFVFQQMFDIERVQILRGPQGTLYGQPSPTGAMILETVDPNLSEIDGQFEASYQNPTGYNIQAGISIPLIKNKLGLRISAMKDERETGLENITRGLENEVNNQGYRIKLLWEPNDEFSAKFGWTSVESKDSDTYRPVESITDAASFKLDASDRTSIQDAPDQMNTREDDLYTLHVDWNPGPVDVRFFAAHHKPKVDSSSDEDGTEQPVQTVDVTGEGINGDQLELRFIASPFEWWDTQFGAYYAKTGDDATAKVVADAGPGLAAVLELNIPTDNEVSAFFTHNDFHVTYSTTITAGLRFNRFENRSSSNTTTQLWIGSQTIPGGGLTDPSTVITVPCADGSTSPCVLETSESVDKWTGTIKVSHAISDQHNMFATYDRGYRPGATNFDISGSIGDEFLTYGGESVNSVEVGLKGSLMEGRAQYTLAAFYAIYDDYQIDPSFMHWSPSQGGPTDLNIVFVNVDEAVQYGWEGEFRMLVNENVMVSTAIGWNQVEFTDGVVPCNDPSQPALSPTNPYNVCSADGEPAGTQPDWTWMLQSEYHSPFELVDGEWFVSGLFNYRGSADHPGDPDGRLSVDEYYQLDLFGGVRNESWTFQVFVKNALDDDAIISKRVLGTDYNDLSLIPPRTVGVTFSYRM